MRDQYRFETISLSVEFSGLGGLKKLAILAVQSRVDGTECRNDFFTSACCPSVVAELKASPMCGYLPEDTVNKTPLQIRHRKRSLTLHPYKAKVEDGAKARNYCQATLKVAASYRT